MTVMELIHKLSELDGDDVVFVRNKDNLFRVVERVERDDGYPHDVLIDSGDVE